MSSKWLGCFEGVLPLRGRGQLHLYSAVDRDGNRRVVMVGAPSVPAGRVKEYLDVIAEVHALLELPTIPQVVARGAQGGVEYLAFDCDAVVDMEYIVERFLGADEPRVPYPQAIALPAMIGKTLAHAHALRHPLTGDPICIGALSLRNVLISESGRMYLIGFGHNLAVLKEETLLGAVPGAFQAPELGAGGKPTPGGDLYAFFLFIQSLMPFVALPEALGRVYQGNPEPEDRVIVENVQWAMENIITAFPPAREQSVVRAMEKNAASWQAMGVTPDPEGWAHYLASLQKREAPQREQGGELAPSGALVVEESGSWFRLPNGERFTLERRAPLRRVLVRLVEKRLSSPGAPATLDELLEAGWPGERPLPQAGANRVYVALSNLRTLGLKEVIRRTGDGWLIDKSLPVERG